MKYFLYCRKSSDREDRQILGPEAQKRLLLEHAAKHGLSIIGVYVEHQTAYKTGRPMFNEMLQRLERGEAQAILTYHLTRLARNSFDGGRLIYMMDEGSVIEITTPEKTYLNNSDDKFMMQIHFAMAKKSSDDTSQFVRRDVESKLLKGEYPGSVPIGYLNINRDGHITKAKDDPEKYMLLLKLNRPLLREEIDPIDGPIVRRFFEEAAKGTLRLPQLRKLSYQLGLRARKTGTILSKNAVGNLLTNPYYYGAIAYNGTLYDDALLQERTGNPQAHIQHQPLISKALFDAVQYALATRGKGRYRKHAFAYGGCIIRCGECGGPITAERQKGHAYYHCTHNRGPCSQKAWTREEVLEQQITALLLKLRLPQGFLDYCFSKLRRAHKLEAQYSAALLQRLQAQVKDGTQRLDSLLRLKISVQNSDGSLLSDEEYRTQKAVLKSELDQTQEQLNAVIQQSGTWIDDCEAFFETTQRMTDRFERASLEEKKVYLHMICSNLTLTDHEVSADYREPYASLAGFPLAGKDADFPSEPREVALAAEKSDLFVNWLGIVTAIRTFGPARLGL